MQAIVQASSGTTGGRAVYSNASTKTVVVWAIVSTGSSMGGMAVHGLIIDGASGKLVDAESYAPAAGATFTRYESGV